MANLNSLPVTAGVYGIYGSLGGGKTLSAVDFAIQFFESRNYVVSNVALKNLKPAWKGRYTFIESLSEVEWENLPIGSPRGSGGRKRVAIILDELPELLDQYSNGKEIWIKTFLSWLRHTSKNGQFVFLITQDPSYILKPVRLLCSYWIRCDDMAQLRLPIFKIKIPFMSGFVMRRLYDRDGNCLNHTMDLVSKIKIGKYYNTAQGLSLFINHFNQKEFSNKLDLYDLQETRLRKLYRLNYLYFFIFLFSFILLYNSYKAAQGAERLGGRFSDRFISEHKKP